MNEENTSDARHLDEKCRNVDVSANAVFLEHCGDAATALRCISEKYNRLIDIHCGTKTGWSIGSADDGDTEKVGSWSLVYEESRARWRGTNENFNVYVHQNTSKKDLKTLLDAFDRVAKESWVMEQPNKFEMRVGFPSLRSEGPDRIIAQAKIKSGTIDWFTNRQGLILCAGLDCGYPDSILDYMVYHEATHLMEPEMQETLDGLTMLVSENKSVTWKDEDLSVDLPDAAERAIAGINPDYLPTKLLLWKKAVKGLHALHRMGNVSDDQFKIQSREIDEDLAAEILVETTCSLFWKPGNVPFPKGEWGALDSITEATVKRMHHLHSISREDRRAFYVESENKKPSRDIVRVFMLPGPSAAPQQGAPQHAGIVD